MRTWHRPLFLLPFALLGARALQAGGIYVLGILLTCVLARRAGLRLPPGLPLVTAGLALVGAYLVFPLADLIHWARGAGEGQDVAWAGLLHSQVSTAVLGSGVALLLLARTRGQGRDGEGDGGAFSAFTRGLLYASILLAAYVAIQHVTGFDFYEANAYRADRRLETGGYRATGFTTHPLTLAAQSLAFFAFYWTLAWLRPRKLEATVAVIHLAIVLATGSRMPAAVALLLLVAVPLAVKGRRLLTDRRALLAGAATLALVLGGGLLSRARELATLAETGMADARFVFWKVHVAMVADSPWLGQGNYWLRAGGREAFYERLGYGAFPRRYNAHNVYLETLANVGIAGAAVLVGLAVWLVIASRKAARGPDERRALFLALGVAVLANAVHGLTQNTFFDSPVAYTYLGLMWALVWTHAA